MKIYKTKSGSKQFMPSIEEVTKMDHEMQGLCLACGEIQENIEPDACRYTCDGCGKTKVYGAAELALMNLCY